MKKILFHILKRLLPNTARNALKAQLEALRMNTQPEHVSAPANKRVIVFAPHMDDETFGCGGTLIHCTNNQCAVKVVFLTDGKKGYNPDNVPNDSEIEAYEIDLAARRKHEAKQACAYLGVTDIVFMDGPDGELPVSTENINRVREVIQGFDPEELFLPFFSDPHDDHWATLAIVMSALKTLPSKAGLRLWGYEIWAPVLAYITVDIGEVIECKQQAMNVYASQNDDYDYPGAFLGLARYRSLLGKEGKGYCEAYYRADYVIYEKLYRSASV